MNFQSFQKQGFVSCLFSTLHFVQNPEGPFGRVLIDGATCTMLGSQELSVTSEGKKNLFNRCIIDAAVTPSHKPIL